MLLWLSNHGGTLILYILLLILTVLAVRSMHKNKNKCGGGCVGCDAANPKCRMQGTSGEEQNCQHRRDNI